MSGPKRHHYNSQMILRNFLSKDENKLWYYDRETNRYDLRTPRGLAHARHLYSYENVLAEQRYVLEHAFSTLEDKAAPIFIKLRKGENITNRERYVIAEFIGMQYFRTPAKLEVIKELENSGSKYAVEGYIERIRSMTDAEFKYTLEEYRSQTGLDIEGVTKDVFIGRILQANIQISSTKGSQLSMMVDAGTKLAIRFSSRTWYVLHTQPGASFITSDTAICVTRDGTTDEYNTHNPAAPGMATLFPFAKDAAILITSKQLPSITHVPFSKKYTSLANNDLARVSNELYSNSKSLLEAIVKKGNIAHTKFEFKPTQQEISRVMALSIKQYNHKARR